MRLSMLQKDSGKARILESITDSRVADLFKRVDVNGAHLLKCMDPKHYVVACEVRLCPNVTIDGWYHKTVPKIRILLVDNFDEVLS